MANRSERGESLLAHLDAAYSLARWLVKNEPDARDIVQDAFLKALHFEGPVKNPKPWFLTIVRNQAYTFLKKRPTPFTEESLDLAEQIADPSFSPEEIILKNVDMSLVRIALLSVSEEHREIFLLREVEDLLTKK